MLETKVYPFCDLPTCVLWMEGEKNSGKGKSHCTAVQTSVIYETWWWQIMCSSSQEKPTRLLVHISKIGRPKYNCNKSECTSFQRRASNDRTFQSEHECSDSMRHGPCQKGSNFLSNCFLRSDSHNHTKIAYSILLIIQFQPFVCELPLLSHSLSNLLPNRRSAIPCFFRNVPSDLVSRSTNRL